jgi:hypothetical protein
LVQHAGVGVLGDEAGAEELEARPLDPSDQAWVVKEAPAPEHQQVAERAGGHAQFVLVNL